MLTQARLRELVRYDPEIGTFMRLVRTSNNKIGDVADAIHHNRYRRISVDGKSYWAHRLAWFYMTGEWPHQQIDHRNGVCDDNRWLNLREATIAENHQNQAARRANNSGLLGVGWDAARKNWIARIKNRGRTTNLGRFADKHAAHAAYLAAKAKLHTFNPTVRAT